MMYCNEVLQLASHTCAVFPQNCCINGGRGKGATREKF